MMMGSAHRQLGAATYCACVRLRLRARARVCFCERRSFFACATVALRAVA
jgi:hypothetical protein